MKNFRVKVALCSVLWLLASFLGGHAFSATTSLAGGGDLWEAHIEKTSVSLVACYGKTYRYSANPVSRPEFLKVELSFLSCELWGARFEQKILHGGRPGLRDGRYALRKQIFPFHFFT